MNIKYLTLTPKVKLEVSKQNFVFKAIEIWNKFIGHALEEMNLQILALLFQDLPEIQI